jgi:hypothetical protein
MGFSFAKLLLLIVVLAVVWFGWRYLRIREKEQEIAAERARQGGVAKAALKEEAEILVPCRVCKAPEIGYQTRQIATATDLTL